MKIHVYHDDDVDNPLDYCGWTLHDFNRRGGNADPNKFLRVDRHGELRGVDLGWYSKLRHGTAFVLSCYQHSAVQWGLQGETWQCPWDTSNVAGILVCDDPKEWPNREARERAARAVLAEYTRWCNGDCWWYELEVDGVEVDCCGGFIGTDWMMECILDAVASHGLDPVNNFDDLEFDSDEWADAFYSAARRRRDERAKAA